MKIKLSLLPLSIVLASFAQHLSAQDEDAAAETADSNSSPTESCFSVRQAQRMTALSDKHIFLESSGDQYFLLTMVNTCPGLEGAEAIAVNGRRQDRVCSDQDVEIAYRPLSVNPPMLCPIETVESVASEEQAEQLVAARTE